MQSQFAPNSLFLRYVVWCDSTSQKLTTIFTFVIGITFIRTLLLFYQAMVGELSTGVFNETGTDSCWSICVLSSAKKSKKNGLDSLLSLYFSSQENRREFQRQVLEIQKQRAAIAWVHLLTFRNVARVESVKRWTQEVERYHQKRKTLKKQFVQHCKNHLKNKIIKVD
jgi:hypothetical protein